MQGGAAKRQGMILMSFDNLFYCSPRANRLVPRAACPDVVVGPAHRSSAEPSSASKSPPLRARRPLYQREGTNTTNIISGGASATDGTEA
jgi:hypothetical protein